MLKLWSLSRTLFVDSFIVLDILLKPVPAILHEAIPATTQHIDSQLQTAQDQAYRYTAILEKAANNPLLSIELQPFMLKEALYNVRQYEIFLQIILVSECHKIWPFPYKTTTLYVMGLPKRQNQVIA